MRHMRIYILAAILPAVILSGLFCYLVFGVTIRPAGSGSQVIYLPEESTFEQVMDSLKTNLRIDNLKVLQWVAEKKNYRSHIKPGRYVIEKGMSCNELINNLRSGKQTPVLVTFSNIKTIYDLAGRVGGKIEADSARIVTFLSDTENYRSDGFVRENIISVFLPDTYEFFWNTGPGEFYSRMLREYKKFWNAERIRKADEKKLTPLEVSVLASIVDQETSMPDEKPVIAGVYLNRLKRGIPLQADPTIKFVINDPKMSRILRRHLSINSPYNTYKYKGLPPGPISCPAKDGIEAVLNADNHDYLYFVARSDFSGYHVFSRTLSEHNRYAAMYRKELNRRKIFR
ncbi:MAG TPA: endolytic transglycosylase MltG [Bacteroidales bacterium]|nr:endolytic transglycosylase MltG [Bacteroidales bacterium]